MKKLYTYKDLELETDEENFINVSSYGSECCSRFLDSTEFFQARRNLKRQLVKFTESGMWLDRVLLFDFLRNVDIKSYFNVVDSIVQDTTSYTLIERMSNGLNMTSASSAPLPPDDNSWTSRILQSLSKFTN